MSVGMENIGDVPLPPLKTEAETEPGVEKTTLEVKQEQFDNQATFGAKESETTVKEAEIKAMEVEPVAKEAEHTAEEAECVAKEAEVAVPAVEETESVKPAVIASEEHHSETEVIVAPEVSAADTTDSAPQSEPQSSHSETQKNLELANSYTDTSYSYFLDDHGRIYSMDFNGFWYVQDDFGNLTPYDLSLGHGHMFPLNEKGLPMLPLGAHGEHTFPYDMNHVPIFPLDPITRMPIFPVDEADNPIFPVSPYGRPVVPVDHNGIPIFPRSGNGHYIFPTGPDGRTVAPVNIFGVPVLPISEKGKPIIPRDANGKPLIHLASDGKTPLTDEEYQYSLQWNNYYSDFQQYYSHGPIPSAPTTRPAPPVNVADPVKQMKMLRKIRPEDIDLPPNEPPKPPTPPPEPVAETKDESTPLVKDILDTGVKAKAKRLLEMQVKFARRKRPENTQETSKENLNSNENEVNREIDIVSKTDAPLEEVTEKVLSGFQDEKSSLFDSESTLGRMSTSKAPYLNVVISKEQESDTSLKPTAPSPVPSPTFLKDVEPSNNESDLQPAVADSKETVEQRVPLQDKIAAELKERVDLKKLLVEKDFQDLSRKRSETKDLDQRSRESEDLSIRSTSSWKSQQSRSKRYQHRSGSDEDSYREQSHSFHQKSSRDSQRNDSPDHNKDCGSFFIQGKRKCRSRNSSADSQEIPTAKRKRHFLLLKFISKRFRTTSQFSKAIEKQQSSKAKSSKKKKKDKKHKHSHRRHSKKNKGEVCDNDRELDDSTVKDDKQGDAGEYGPTRLKDIGEPSERNDESVTDEGEKKRKKKSKKEKKKKKRKAEEELVLGDKVNSETVDAVNENINALPKNVESGLDENDVPEKERNVVIMPETTITESELQKKEKGCASESEALNCEFINGKVFYVTAIQPLIKYTSNPKMQESFMKLKDNFAALHQINSPSAIVEASTSSCVDKVPEESSKTSGMDILLEGSSSEGMENGYRGKPTDLRQDELRKSPGLSIAIQSRMKKPKDDRDICNNSPTKNDLNMDSLSDTNVEEGRDDEELSLKKKMTSEGFEAQDDEEELCRLRYEALRSKTKRLMNDLRTERRRLKRERIRAIYAIRRSKGASADKVNNKMLVSESSGSSSSEASITAADNHDVFIGTH